MRAQMYCIKHIELNADMEKKIISYLLIQISMVIRWDHFDFRTFAFMAKMVGCKSKSAKMLRRSVKTWRRKCEIERVIQHSLLRLAHSHFCLCIF